MKTPWFNAATQNPHRVGVYEVRGWFGSQFYSCWNGEWWGIIGNTEEAYATQRHKSASMDCKGVEWRGLLK